MKFKFLVLAICLSLLSFLLSACSPTGKADKELEKSTYKMNITVDIITENESVRNCFSDLESIEAEIRVGDSLTYIHYSNQPTELCYEHDEYWITDSGYIIYRYIMNDPPKAEVKRLSAQPTKEELDLFLLRATTFAGVTREDFDTCDKDGKLLTYTDYTGAKDGYLRDIVYVYSSFLAGESDFGKEDITLLGATLTARLDDEGRYAEQVLMCEYKALAAGVEYEFAVMATMTYNFDAAFNVSLPDDYFDDKFTRVPYDEAKFAYLRMNL